MRTASELEKLWWDLHQEAFAQAETKFNEWFFRAFEWPDVLSKYRPLALLDWLKPPDLLRTTSVGIKLARARQLRPAFDKLNEFASMSFAQVSERLEEIDRKSRQRLIAPST